MKVSKSLLVWMLAVLAALTFAFLPAAAGDHPWNEDESGGGSGDGGEPEHGGTQPEDPFIIDPENLDVGIGCGFFWWQLIIDRVLTDNKNESVTAKTAGTREPSLTGGLSQR